MAADMHQAATDQPVERRLLQRGGQQAVPAASGTGADALVERLVLRPQAARKMVRQAGADGEAAVVAARHACARNWRSRARATHARRGAPQQG